MSKVQPTFSASNAYELLVQGVVDYAIYMLDPEGRIASWNPGAYQIKGYTHEEIIGEHFSRFYTEEDRVAGLPEQALRTAAETGRFSAEAWRVRKDGSRFWAQVVIDALRDDKGRLIGFAKITRDISERHEAQLALLESERRFRLLVQGVTDYAIYMLDPEGRVTNWNLGAERIKGYTSDEILGQHFSRFYSREDLDRSVPQTALATAQREGRYEAEGWRLRKDGRRFWASVVIDAIRDEEGILIGFAKITRDVTERKEAQARLEESREQLFQSQKMEAVGQLTGGIAHDFNNLLQIVTGNLEILDRNLPEDSGRLRRAVQTAMLGAQRAATLTQRLLAFSRRQTLDPKPIDVNQLVARMSDLLRRTLGEPIEIETVLAGGLWRVEADPHQLENALLNLAVNARDAMPRGGKLTIETANTRLDEAYARENVEVTPGQYVAVCVTDTGFGMSRELLARVFEPFFTTKEVGRGTGLGLSMVYGFVKQSGGHVKLYSEEQHGTTVKVYLPRLFGPLRKEEVAPHISIPEGHQEEVILVVEDDDDVRAWSGGALRELGYSVLEAHDGPSALRTLDRAGRVDLLFTDVGLPGGMTGRELSDVARKRRAGLKVLFTTGYARNAIVHNGRLDPDVKMIGKPFTFADLAAQVRDVLDSRP
ncbi:MAG: PAS domain-containing sensor histidine kinase [Beijerinckiaceae bacterium]